MKIIKLTLAVLLLLTVAALSGAGRPEPADAAGEEPIAGITVTGEGKAHATPDRASMSFGVQSEGPTAGQALTTNSEAVRRLVAALKAAGVAAKDLKTEHFDVSPRYDEDKVPEQRGYSASASVSVSNQPLDRASRLGELGVKAGADTVSGPGLVVADPEADYRSALKGAFADAREKAETLASAAGVSLAEVTAIVEGSHPQPYFADMAAARALEKTPIEPGSQQITAVVTVTFEIR